MIIFLGSGSNYLISQKFTELQNFYIIDIFKGNYVNFENFEIMLSSDYLRHDPVLNYLTLFVSRFHVRKKELALRVVFGATEGSLLVMLSVEFLLTLLLAVGLGGFFTLLTHNHFLEITGIQMELSAVYLESFIYVCGVIIISMFVFWLTLFIFKRQNLNVSIRHGNKKMLRKTSITVQIIISVCFAFCSAVILKQMYFLHNTKELGFSFKNRGSISLLMKMDETGDAFANQLRQIPEIIEVVNAGNLRKFIPYSNVSSWNQDVISWDDKPADITNVILQQVHVTPEYLAFYELQTIAGEMLIEADSTSMILINEAAALRFGWNDPVGKQFSDGAYTVKGVVKNVYNLATTLQPEPVFYRNLHHNNPLTWLNFPDGPVKNVLFLFKYHEGTWESSKEKIEQLINDNDYMLDIGLNRIFNAEEEYRELLKSDIALLKLLMLVSAVCVFICIFGFVSIISLNCGERRKEIALRKVNGATSGDIFAMFAKEYFMLLIIGSLIAFTAGYFIMHSWLQQYAIRTNIPVWLYLSIVFVMSMVIFLCAGRQVYNASTENPVSQII